MAEVSKKKIVSKIKEYYYLNLNKSNKKNMKKSIKKIIYGFTCLAIVLVASVSFNIINSDKNFISLDNVEALAGSDEGDVIMTITNRKGKIVYQCFEKPKSHCVQHKFGYTMKIDDGKDDQSKKTSL